MTEKKLVKRDYFNEVIELAKANGRDDLVKFAEHELELLAKKNGSTRKPTEVQKQNEVVKTEILEYLRNEPNKLFTITDMIKAIPCCNELTNQKVSAIVRQLVNDGAVVKTVDKRKSYFQIA